MEKGLFDIVRLHFQLLVNCVSLYTGRLDYPSAFGTGLYLPVSVLNHSCEPNARVEFDGGKAASVIALKDIETDASYLGSVIDAQNICCCNKISTADEA